MKDIQSAKLFRDPVNAMIKGVCAGIARHFDIDVLWVRGATALAFVFMPTAVALAYVLAILLIPKRSFV